MATELFTAIKGGDHDAVERLLEGDRALADSRDESGLSPILATLEKGSGDQQDRRVPLTAGVLLLNWRQFSKTPSAADQRCPAWARGSGSRRVWPFRASGPFRQPLTLGRLVIEGPCGPCNHSWC